MNDTGEIRRSLVEIQEDQRRQQRRQRERPARLMIWWGWIVAGVSAVSAAVIVGWILGKPELVHMRETINPLVLSVGVAGVLIAGLGHVLLNLRRGQEAQRAEWAEATKGLDPTALGRLAAQMQSVELANTLLASALRKMDDIEKQVVALNERLDGDQDDAFVDALSEREDSPKVNGHKVARIVRPAWPRNTDRDRRT